MSETTTLQSPVAPGLGHKATGALAAGLSLFLIGTSAPVAATIHEVPLLTGQAARYLVAGLLLVAIMIIRRSLQRSRRPTPIRLRRSDLLDIVLLGTVGIAGFNVFLVSASYRVDPALVGTVLAATPVLLAVISPLLVRCRPSGRVVVGAVVVTAGTVYITGVGAADPLGILLCAGALACELAFTLVAVRLIERFGTFATTTLAAVSGGAVLIMAALIFDGPGAATTIMVTPGDAVRILYLALAVAIGANLAWYLALPRLGPARSGLFYALSPVGAIAASAVLGIGLPAPVVLVGLGVVALGVIIGIWPQRIEPNDGVRRTPQRGTTHAREPVSINRP
ncbi:DMT family transporter [Microlunatus parietis]|uniref:Drug/metabolite transporter (DMT)-like permease n=1 Tax=Microlunatus parietis TaxID=682979 RepID=A0A7Y9I4J4_9ACTN|nr:DMT family transporter [Microlunatus parietis]NYE69968.1 drug/metabolite transporter (DMT)-like permease [Microlunatus parietis]